MYICSKKGGNMVEVQTSKKNVSRSSAVGNCSCVCAWYNDFNAQFEAFLHGDSCGCACPSEIVHELTFHAQV